MKVIYCAVWSVLLLHWEFWVRLSGATKKQKMNFFTQIKKVVKKYAADRVKFMGFTSEQQQPKASKY